MVAVFHSRQPSGKVTSTGVGRRHQISRSLGPGLRESCGVQRPLLAGGPKQSPDAARAERYFTRARVKMLSAEQVLDAVSLATGVVYILRLAPPPARTR